MITDALLLAAKSLVSFLFGLVPEWHVDVPPAVGSLASMLSEYNKLLPFAELMLITQASQLLFLAWVTYRVVVKLIDWITNVIP